MSFFIGLAAWLIIAAVLVVGVVMATNNSFIVLVVGLLAFVAAFAKFGCLTH